MPLGAARTRLSRARPRGANFTSRVTREKCLLLGDSTTKAVWRKLVLIRCQIIRAIMFRLSFT